MTHRWIVKPLTDLDLPPSGHHHQSEDPPDLPTVRDRPLSAADGVAPPAPPIPPMPPLPPIEP